MLSLASGSASIFLSASRLPWAARFTFALVSAVKCSARAARAEPRLQLGINLQECLLRSAVSWIVNGVAYAHLSQQQLQTLSDTDYVAIKPPPSKADPFALVWGNRPTP